MFERFTDRARKALALGNQQAVELKHDYIGSEHVLLGILKEGSGVAAAILRNLNADLPSVRAQVLKRIQPGARSQANDIQQAVQAAVDEAKDLGHSHVGTEHLLLGVLRGGGIGAQALESLGVSHQSARKTLLDFFKNSPEADAGGTAVHSAKAAEPLGPYPHARRAGNLLFLSGIGPRKRGSKDIPGAVVDASGNLTDYSIEAEMRSCFENIRTILDEAGSRWENIVDVQVFLTDMKRDWPTYNRVYAEFFPPGLGQPTRTTVEVSALPTGGHTPIHFEIKIIATVGGSC